MKYKILITLLIFTGTLNTHGEEFFGMYSTDSIPYKKCSLITAEPLETVSVINAANRTEMSKYITNSIENFKKTAVSKGHHAVLGYRTDVSLGADSNYQFTILIIKGVGVKLACE